MRLQSWILVSREAELCSWVVAQRSLLRMASSASCNTCCTAGLCGLAEGRGGARAVVEAGVKGEGTAGGGKAFLPPAAAPSQCSGLGTDTLAWLLLGPPLSSAPWSGVGVGAWAASCLSLTWDKAAWAFKASVWREERKTAFFEIHRLIKTGRAEDMKSKVCESGCTRVVLVNIWVQLLTWDTVFFLLSVLKQNRLDTQNKSLSPHTLLQLSYIVLFFFYWKWQHSIRPT